MLSILKTNIKIALFISVAILLVSSSDAAIQKALLNKGIVHSSKLNIRKTPSIKSRVVGVVKKGETLDVIEEPGKAADGWITVVYNGKKGYVRNRSQYIKLLSVLPVKQIKKKALKEKSFKRQTKKEQGTAKIEQLKAKIGKGKAKIKAKQKIQARIDVEEKMVATFSQKEVEIIDRLNEIDYALNKTRRKVLALSTESLQLEEKIEQLKQSQNQLSKKIVQNREYAGQRLRAIYKMNMIGRLDVAGLPTSVFDFFLQQNSMKRIISSDYTLIEKQDLDFYKFEILEVKLQKEIEAKALLEVEYKGQIQIHNEETLKKELILRQIRKKKKLSLAAVDSLKQSAFELDNQIDDLQKKGASKLAKFSFSRYKGQLMIPVRGKIISQYGPTTSGDYKSFTFQKGIDIKVERGEPVKSVFKGEVLFAQWLKGYGNLLIINHGDNYYTLYGHVEEFFKKKGEAVETGEVIATAGDTGSIKGTCLHFELRHHGKPVNPVKWLKKGA